MDLRERADKLGWIWIAALLPAWVWLGQGGAPCPPEGPPPGSACPMVLIGRDGSLIVVAFLAGAGILLDQQRDRIWSGVFLLGAAVLAGTWGATKQFLGSAWYAPRVPVVIFLTLPPLLVAIERFTRGSSSRAAKGQPLDTTPEGTSP